jgi:hypothetical protein
VLAIGEASAILAKARLAWAEKVAADATIDSAAAYSERVRRHGGAGAAARYFGGSMIPVSQCSSARPSTMRHWS